MYIYYVYIILSVIVFSSLSFYGEWTIPGTRRQPAILKLIDVVFFKFPHFKNEHTLRLLQKTWSRMVQTPTNII